MRRTEICWDSAPRMCIVSCRILVYHMGSLPFGTKPDQTNETELEDRAILKWFTCTMGGVAVGAYRIRQFPAPPPS